MKVYDNKFETFTMTINVTEKCNLRCKYCYELYKNSSIISIDYCKNFIDLVMNTDFTKVDNSMPLLFENIDLDLIGGEVLLYPELCDEILTYFQYAIRNDKRKINWRCSISSNGTLLRNEKVQKLIIKWNNVLSLGISLDGTPELHDLNRVYPNGNGSMKNILEGLEWLKRVSPGSLKQTKSTISKNSIPYMYDSLRYLHEELGLNYIHQNFIMENAYLDQEDLDLFDEQMKLCCDYVFHHLDDLYWSMIDYHTFYLHSNAITDQKTTHQCGSGIMPALAIDGKIYPCFRWLPLSQKTGNELMICGDVNDKILNLNKFQYVYNNACRRCITKEEKCQTCEYESACAYCVAGCYSEFKEFKRTTYICEITKRQAKWAHYYWSRIITLAGEYNGRENSRNLQEMLKTFISL
ncbi:MAG: radical SAM protein [Rickettsiales bacterium]|jgi:uncharacterized protein|nr:radical SAM protein [Rickettsiales bacterium]